MNMLLRFFIMISLLKRELKLTPKHSTLSQSELQAPITQYYRILPQDMGWRNHLPNYRYLSFIELNITNWLISCCHKKGIKMLRWVMAMQEVVYLKQVSFLDKLEVTSRLLGWDEKYLYFEHQFFVKQQLRAVGLTKIILVDAQGKRAPSELDLAGVNLNDIIQTWNANQDAIKAKFAKRYTN